MKKEKLPSYCGMGKPYRLFPYCLLDLILFCESVFFSVWQIFVILLHCVIICIPIAFIQKQPLIKWYCTQFKVFTLSSHPGLLSSLKVHSEILLNIYVIAYSHTFLTSLIWWCTLRNLELYYPIMNHQMFTNITDINKHITAPNHNMQLNKICICCL